MSPIREVDTREALGLLGTIKWEHELDLDEVDFEIDFKSVTDNVNSQQLNLFELDDIIKKNKCLLTRYFMNSHIKYVSRQSNKVTGAFTQLTLSLASS